MEMGERRKKESKQRRKKVWEMKESVHRITSSYATPHSYDIL